MLHLIKKVNVFIYDERKKKHTRVSLGYLKEIETQGEQEMYTYLEEQQQGMQT